jgi:hypothetical protein
MIEKDTNSIEIRIMNSFYEKFPYIFSNINKDNLILYIRIILLSFIIILFFNGIISGIIYLILMIVLFIFICIIQNRNMNRNMNRDFNCNQRIQENFEPTPNKNNILYYLPRKINNTQVNIKYNENPKSMYNIRAEETKDFCDREYDQESSDSKKGIIQLNYDQSFVSKNKLLAGNANPKTRIAPVLAPRSHDLEEWRDNEFITLSLTNSETRSEIYNSGYTNEDSKYYNCNNNRNINENYTAKMQNRNIDSRYTKDEGLVEYLGQREGYERSVVEERQPRELNNEKLDYTDPMHYFEPDSHIIDEAQYTTLIGDYCALKKDNPLYNLRGEVNTQFGYDRENLSYNIPVNANTSRCDKTDRMKSINKNIYTQTIQPGSYMMNEVIDSLDTNIGISLNEPMHKISCNRDENGNLIWTTHDPNNPPMYEELPENERVENAMAEFNVYDPRSNGYGTSYRGYNHDITGQPRFMYDDIDAIIQPNYITRSNIDFEKYADSYGPKRNRGGNESTANMRELVENSWVDNSLNFREDMQMRLLRKFNTRNIQRRMAPMRTSNASSYVNRCK